MQSYVAYLRLVLRPQFVALVALVLLFCSILVGISAPQEHAVAAANTTINFQARLMTGTGGLAPDGDYNIEFKIYDTVSTGGTAQGVCTGACKWVETRTGVAKVHVANGYVTVNLGSVSSFASTINWDQDLWITMNVGGTGSPTWDGEMSPRLKLTAVPFAFRAGALAGGTGSSTTVLDTGTPSGNNLLHLPAETGTLCVQGASACGFAPGTASSYIQNQSGTSQTADFRITGTGRADTTLQAPALDATSVATTLTIGATNATSITVGNTANNTPILLQSGTGTITARGNNTSAFQVQNASSVALLSVNTTGTDTGVHMAGTGTGGGGGRLYFGPVGDVTTFIGETNDTNTNSLVFQGNYFTFQHDNDFVPLQIDAVNGQTIVKSFDGTYGGFIVRKADNNQSFSVAGDSTKVTIGNNFDDGTGTLLVLDTKDDAGDPTIITPINGSMYYNSAVSKFRCYEGSAWKDCIDATAGSAFLQGGNSFSAAGVLGTNDNNSLQVETNNVVRATFDTSNTMYLGLGATAPTPTNFTVAATGSSTAGTIGASLTIQGGAGAGVTTGSAGGDLTLQGGNAGGSGNNNGGGVTVRGGTGTGTGVRGLVNMGPAAFSSVTNTSCGSNCTISQANVDGFGAIVVNTSASSLTVTMPDPTILTAGRVIYITGADNTNDFTLAINSGGTLVNIAMRENSTATLIWNGSDWTAAGASSSTTLQSAYDSTLTSAGGAEIVLNNSASSNGLTIRNNASNPVVGGILEVQASIGTNLFSVNNNISELVANGGAEDSATFATNWTALGGSTITRNTTSNQFATGTAGVSVAAGTTAGNGVRQNLASNPATNTSYLISFTAQLASGSPAFTDLRVDYTPTGAANGTQCIAGQTIVTGGWTKITCEFTTPATTVTNADILIYQAGAAGSARTFYIDNLSMTLADNSGGIPNNVQIGGGIYGGPPTLFTLDRSSAPPVANGNTTYLGSMYYDTTSGRIQCYESDGWGACGSAPNNIISLTPEYSGAVLNGTGIGTLSADFCANSAALTVGSLCASGISRNFYKWTSPQATEQVYSIYVSYKLPTTFKAFDSANTMTLTWLTDSANGTNGKVTYQVYRSTGAAITSCDGTTESTVTTPTANTWYTTAFNGDETACGFAGGDNIIFKINVKAKSNANVYVENLNFTYTNT